MQSYAYGSATTSGNAANQIKRSSQQSPLVHLDKMPSRHQIYNLPTSINVTAPSPIGSVRDVCHNPQQFSESLPPLPTPIEQTIFTKMGASSLKQRTNCCQSPIKRHSHQDLLSSCDQQLLIDKTSQINLSLKDSHGDVSSLSWRGVANCLPGQHRHSQQQLATTMAVEVRDEASESTHEPEEGCVEHDDKSRSKLIDELLKTINDDSFDDFINFNSKYTTGVKAGGGTNSQPGQINSSSVPMVDQVNANRPKSAFGGDGAANWYRTTSRQQQPSVRPSTTPRPPRTLNFSGSGQTSGGGGQQGRTSYQPRGSICVPANTATNQQQLTSSTFDNVIRRMSTNFVQNLSKMSAATLGNSASGNPSETNTSEVAAPVTSLRCEKSSTPSYPTNSLYVDNQIPARRHSDNTINMPRIQVGMSSPSSSGPRTNLSQRASLSASKLATKWKLTAKTNQRDASDKLSPNLSCALGYIRRHSSGNTQGGGNERSASGGIGCCMSGQNANGNEQNQSNGLGTQLLNASPFKVSCANLLRQVSSASDNVLRASA